MPLTISIPCPIFAPDTGTGMLAHDNVQDEVHRQKTNDQPGAIVQVLPHLESGPVGRFATDLAITVQRLGGECKMISSGGRFAQEAARSGIEHETIDLDSGGLLGIGSPTRKLKRLMDKWDTRLVHTHGSNSAVTVRKTLKSSSVHHVASLYRLPHNDGASDAGSNAILAADRVIVSSDFLKKILISNNPQEADRVTVIPPGIAIQALHPSVVTAVRLTRLIKKVTIPTANPIILFPAAVQANAGHDLLLDVLEQISDIPWSCVMATIGPSDRKLRQHIQTRINKLGFENKIRFIENCDDPATLYKLSAIVISSIMGNLAFDYAAAEAQAAGKLVLVPNSGSSKTQIEAGEDGAMFETADRETLEMALRWALTLPHDQQASIEHAATTRAYKSYKKDEIVKRVFEIYDNILA